MRNQKQYAITPDKYLTPDEVDMLMAILLKYPGRDANLIEMLLKTGARAQELLNIKRKDINPKTGGVFIRGLKDSNDRTVFLKPQSLNKLLSLFEGDDIPVSYKTLQRAWYNYRPVKKKTHALRHTFAVNLYEETKDLMMVKRALGHKAINSTMVYVDLIDGDEKLKAVAR